MLRLGAAVSIMILIEALVFNREYVFYKLAGLEPQDYSLKDGALYGFRFKHARLLAQTNDPNITFENINAVVSGISLRCKNTISGFGQVFYRNKDEPFSEARSIGYQTNSNYYSWTLVLPNVQKVSALRFDLTNIQNDAVVCSEIVINPYPGFQFSVFRLAIYAGVLIFFFALLMGSMRKSIQHLVDSSHFQSLAIALVAIFLVFPDVISMGTSLRITDQFNGAFQPSPVEVFYPQAAHRLWYDHYFDAGGALYQSEPMMQFMLHSIQKGESPYWNPYSAAGGLGPETLIDNKFSVFTLAYAILGGGTLVYNLLLLFLQFWAAYFTYRLAKERLRVSVLAATAATVVYLLNGYAVSNLGSNATQGYLYVPMCLYTSISFLGSPSVARNCGNILSFAALFSCTFIPTTFTGLAGIYGVLIGYAIMLNRNFSINPSRVLRIMAAHGLCLFASVLLLALIYLPLAENIGSTSIFGAYAERLTTPSSWLMIPSIFSPSHFFESYGAMDSDAIKYVRLASKNWVVFHFGATALSFAICAISLKKRDFTPLVVSCMATVIIGFGPIFAIPGISSLISRVPVIGGFSEQYWWPLVVIPMIILVAIGVDNLQRQSAIPSLTFLLLAVLVVSLVAVGWVYGLRAPNVEYKKWSIALIVIIASVASVSMFVSGLVSRASFRTRIIAGLVLLLFIELTMDSKVMRFERNDMFALPPPEVQFIEENIGLYRTLTITPLSQNIGLRPELGSAFGIQEITSINLGTLPSYIDYFHNAISLDKSQRKFYSYYPSLREIQDTPHLNTINWPVIDMLGVKYIIVPKVFINYRQVLLDYGLVSVFETSGAYVYQNPNVLPRAFTIDWDQGQKNQLVVLAPDARSKLKPATITLYRNAEVRLEGNVDKESLLVLTDNWHANWTVYVNGVETSIIRVNGTFRGVQVPPGLYEVRMVYQPRSLKAAILCTSAIILLITYLLLDQNRIDKLLAKEFFEPS